MTFISTKFEKHLTIGLVFFIVFMLYKSVLYHQQIATIGENPAMVFGKVSNVSQYTNAVLVHFEYSYRGINYFNQETLVYTDYKILDKSTPTFILLNTDQPQISRLVLKQTEFEKYKHLLVFQLQK